MLYPKFTLIPFSSSGLSNVRSYARPAVVDIDGDGDLDAFVGNLDGDTLFYKNIGPVSSSTFGAPETNSFGLINVGRYSKPTFVDIDIDGDLDAFVGNQDGNTLFFKNTGTFTNPVFAAPTDNPFGLSDTGYNATPTFADIDDDGDMDGFVGNRDGNTLFYKNTGTTSNPNFATAITNPFGLSDVGYSSIPTLADSDGDGDFDAFVGSTDGNTFLFENTGTSSNPIFVAGALAPYGLSDVGFSASPTLADSDGDGDLDAYVGNRDGETLLFRNTGTVSNPVFTTPANNPFGLSDVEGIANPTFADIDGDGDFDAFLGNNDGITQFFRNTGTISNPVFAAPSTNPFGLIDVGFRGNPTFADIDGDGDFDAFVGNNDGITQFFRNTGTISNPVFAAPSTNPFGLIDVGGDASPTFVDIDGDGDLDAFVGNLYGDTLFFRNTGTAINPIFTTVVTNPFGLSNVGYYANPNFVDIDGDGDFDVFISSTHVGDSYGHGRGGDTLFFENTGTASNPQFTASETNPYGLSDAGRNARPAFEDIDNDGDADLFVVNSGGETLFLINNSGLLLASTAGNDILTGTSANNNDTVTYASATGPVTVTLNLTTQQNTIGAGLDTLTSIENLIGSPYDDNLTGNPADNVLRGGDGNDILRGWSGADTMIGGFGDDIYFVENVGDVITEYPSRGTENVNSNVTYRLSANVENLTLTGVLAIDGTGNEDNNNITGNSANNVLNGGLGSDALNGGAGEDTLIGGFGDDSYVVDNINDVIIENSTYLYYGTDSVSSNVSYTLSAGVENLALAGISAINGTGNSSNNNITGNNAINILTGEAGNDTLNGGIGADTMIGGLGSDNYVVENVGDVITENLAEGTDKISSSVTYTLPANVEYLILTGASPINGTGSNQANNIIGNTASNQLDGGAANDTIDSGAGDDTLNGGTGTDAMSGGLGDDIYFIDNGGDVIIENLNEGIDHVNSKVTYILPVNVENLTLTGTSAINGTGNSLNNIITGNNAANQLNGDAGNDTLNGGAGDDILIGWSGADAMLGGLGNDIYLVENAGDVVTENLYQGTDTVSSRLTYTLPANVENLTLTGTSAVNGTGNGQANVITGNAANNLLNGVVGNDILNDGAGNDTLNGGAGNDTLDGGIGTNTLTGGTGNDVFKFTTLGHIDTITDYNVANDTIQLENGVFTALTTTGTLAAGQFRIGTQAVDANDFIIYNNVTGALLYDANGSGAGAAVQIATIGVGLAMTNAEFVVI